MVNNNEDLTMTVMINAFSNIARYNNYSPATYNNASNMSINSTDRDHRWLEWFEQKFSGLPDEIDFQEFKTVLHIKEVRIIKHAISHV